VSSIRGLVLVIPRESLECDVLVVGAAAAGLTAAIEARMRGASVLVACKGKAGRSGNTVVAGSQLAAVVPYPGSEDSPEQHFEDTLAGGRWVNDEDLLAEVVSRAGPQLLRAEGWGMRLLRSEGELVRRTPPGHRFPRGIQTDNAAFPVSTAGLSITLPLRRKAEEIGVHFLEDCPVIRLLLSDGEVAGALAVDMEGDRLLTIGARAVIVAAGGGGQLFDRTNNTRGIAGGSFGLLLEAGVALRDMEFVQFYPCQMNSPFKTVIASPLFSEGAVLRNRHGERFMPLYDPDRGDLATRDVMCQAIFYELQKGNGIDGEVYMDCTAVPEEVLQRKYFSLVRDLRRHGIDPARQWLRVTATTHFFMGGARVDRRCATRVPGLFAAGEAVGGVHGANRLSGNALSEAITTGALAGAAAAEHAQASQRRGSRPDPAPVSPDMGGTLKPDALEEIRAELRRAMWNGASIVRSEASLRAALDAARTCARAASECGATTPALMARREETRLMALAAEAVVISALARRESRGAHFREDFPRTEDRWLGSNLVRLGPEGLEVVFVPKQGESL